MPLEDSYRRQVELLVKALPSVAQEPCFAVKGGTAINLFVRDDMPRLSVDIDLTYLPVFGRDESLRNIDSGLHRIAAHVETALPSVRAAVRNHKVWLSDATTQIKAEVSPVLRGSVYDSQVMSVSNFVEQEFGGATIQVVSFADLYAGKIMASLSRQHPRDWYDVHGLLANEGIDDKLRAAFVVYLISGNKPTWVVLSPRRTDLSDVYRNHLFGMLNEPVSLDTLYETREALVAEIMGNMPDHHRQFLLAFEKRQPDWDLLEVRHARALPAVQWRMLNLAKLGDKKRTQLVSRLEAVLGESPAGVTRPRTRKNEGWSH